MPERMQRRESSEHNAWALGNLGGERKTEDKGRFTEDTGYMKRRKVSMINPMVI